MKEELFFIKINIYIHTKYSNNTYSHFTLKFFAAYNLCIIQCFTAFCKNVIFITKFSICPTLYRP